MTEKATILIPDISGFTEFVTRTELDHSSHIINELLNLIIEQNHSGFCLSEIEGDAILFYRKGEALSKKLLVQQCTDMFIKFHEALKYMERDVICKCGACQSASKLTLKFIIHHGLIKEFTIADIVKASGVDMIIAHRLLKNNINSNEYILLSSSCLDSFADRDDSAGLKWNKHMETYPAIGKINIEFAELEEVKNKIPPVPERRTFIRHEGGDTLEIEINAPINEVYQKAIDIDSLPEWMLGIIGIRREQGVERIGTKHVCLTPTFEMDVELDYAELKYDSAIIVNKFAIRGTDMTGIGTDCLKKLDENTTLLTDTSIWNVPEDMKKEMNASTKMSLELFKALCEGKEINKQVMEKN